MGSFVSHLKWLLPKRDKGKPIEERLFQITLTLTILTVLIWSLVGIFTGYTLFIEAIYLFSLVFYFSLYLAFKKGKSFRFISLVYYLTALTLIALAWFPSGGIKGAVIHMCVLIYLSGLLVLPLRNYQFFMLCTLLLVVSFVLVEFYYPDLAAPYTNEVMLWRDLSTAGILMLVLMGVCLYLFKKEYQEDKNRLRQTNEELASEKVKVESADKAKSQFLATMSHEMRTPLNGIVGISELLSKTTLNQEQKDLVDSLGISSHILHGLISDVLDLTMIENGKMILNEEDFELAEAMNEMIDMFETKISGKKNTVKLNYLHDAHLPRFLKGDWVRIRQVLINLVNNAIKFTSEGAITISSSLHWKNDEIASVRFSVEDTGPGIPGEQQEELFKRFFKADDYRIVEGTGLGLSISKSLVHMMGGKIWFTSVLHVGSSFFIEIPLKISSEVKPKQPVEKDPELLKSLRILLAEDVEINRMVVLKVLKNLGIAMVEVAADGREAIDKSTAAHFDFILMDVQMPKVNGIDASIEINRRYLKKGVPPPMIIAVTANAMKEDAEACRRAGMADFLTKPFRSDTLADLFYKHLRNKKKKRV